MHPVITGGKAHDADPENQHKRIGNIEQKAFKK